MTNQELPSTVSALLRQSQLSADSLNVHDMEVYILSGYRRLKNIWNFANELSQTDGNSALLRQRFTYLYIHPTQTRSNSLFDHYVHNNPALPISGQTEFDSFTSEMIQKWIMRTQAYPDSSIEVLGFKTMEALANTLGSYNSFEEALTNVMQADTRKLYAVTSPFALHNSNARPALQFQPTPDGVSTHFVIHVTRISDNPIEQRAKTLQDYHKQLTYIKEHYPPELQSQIVFKGISPLVALPIITRGIRGFSEEEGAEYQSYDPNKLLIQLREAKREQPSSSPFFAEAWFKNKYPNAREYLINILGISSLNLELSNIGIKSFLKEGRAPIVGIVNTAPGAVLK